MNCICRKLPIMTDCQLIKCVKISMNNGEEYTVKTDDLVGIQFIKHDERILVRRGRIKDIVVINKRHLSNCNNDNVSRIILDCSEQFTVKTIEIKLKDIIKIGRIDDVFEDYSDRITHLKPNFIEGNRIPTREHGMITEEELEKKITKPDRDDVVKMDPETGVFDDLVASPSDIEIDNKEEVLEDKITRPAIDDVVKMDPSIGTFDDLDTIPSGIESNKEEEKPKESPKVNNNNESLAEKMKKAGIIGMPIMM